MYAMFYDFEAKVIPPKKTVVTFSPPASPSRRRRRRKFFSGNAVKFYFLQNTHLQTFNFQKTRKPSFFLSEDPTSRPLERLAIGCFHFAIYAEVAVTAIAVEGSQKIPNSATGTRSGFST